MNKVILFDLVHEVIQKDSTGQTKKIKTYQSVLGTQKSVYQNEFFKADQAGIRPQGQITMCSFDYNAESLLRIDSKEYTIYRTFEVGTDKIELYYCDRVGND